MARYASDNRLNLKVGVSSFSKDLTSLEVIGRVGINSSTAQNELDVAGSVNITNGLSVGGPSTFTGVGTFVSDLYVGGDLYVNDDVVFDEVTASHLNITGIGSFGSIDVNTDATIGRNLNVTGLSTLTGIVTTGSDLYVGGDLYIHDDIVFDEFSGRNINISGVATIGNLNVAGLTTTTDLTVFRNTQTVGVTTLSSDGGITTTGGDLFVGGDLFFGSGGQVVVENLNVTGVTTLNTLGVSGATTTKDLLVTGLSTLTGIVTTGTDLYVGGNLFIANNITFDEVDGTNLFVSGVGTIGALNVPGLTTTRDLTVFRNTQTVGVTTLSSAGGITTTGGDLYVGGNFYLGGLEIGPQGITAVNLDVSGIATIATLGVTGLATAKDLLVTGISTFTGIVTTGSDLYVENDLYVKGNSNLNDTLVSGALTATTFTGAGTGLTGITSATNATNIYGGLAGQLLYQAQPGVTSTFEYGSTNFALVSRGLNNPPQWAPAAPSGAIEGILLFDEGTQVGAGVTYAGIDFRGQEVLVEGAPLGGIATVYVSRQPYVEQAGVSTSVVGGAASVTSLNVDAGISTFADFKITSSGVGATVGASAGVATYYGTGIELAGIVTTITAGDNISINQSTGNVTITGLAKTDRITAESLVVTGVSTLGIITGAESLGVGSIYATDINSTGVITATSFSGNGINLSGIVTSITAGANIAIDQSTGNVTIVGLADTSVITADNLFVAGVSTFQGEVTAGDINSSGVVTATSFSGSGTNLSGIVTSLIAGANISLSGSTGEVTITGLANTANVSTNTLVVSGVSTLGIITGAESLGVGTVYASNFVGGDFNGVNGTFSGNVSIAGTLTYEDVASIDAVGFITAQQGINVGGGQVTNPPVTDYSEVTLSGFSPSSFNETYARQTTGFVLDTGTVASGNALFKADSNYYYYVATTGGFPDGRIIIFSEEDNEWVALLNLGDDYTEGNILDNEAVGSVTGSTSVTSSSTSADGRNVPTASGSIVYATSGGGTSTAGIAITFLANGSGVFTGIVTVGGDFNVGSASSQFTVQQTATTVEVGIGTIDPNYNLDVRGTANIEGDLTVNGNTVPSLAMVVALGGF